MELTELAVSNFKRFTEGQFRFCPGLNLIWGLNESGKSTIHEAICCALFGRERGQVVENWNGGCCSVELTYRSDGRLFRIERRLTEGTCRLGSLAGDDLADVVSNKDEIDRTLAEHLGITSRSVFDNTVSVRQANLSRADSSDMEAVESEIQRVLTGTAHVSAAEALERLEAGRRAIKGRARQSNPREHDRITERLSKLAGELAQARGLRERVRNLEEELAELEARIARDTERQGVLEVLLERHKRWSELKRREGEEDGLHKSVFGTLKSLKDTLEDLKFVQKELVGYADMVGKDEEIGEQLSKIANRRTELKDRLNELESAEEESEPARAGLAPLAFLVGALMLGLAGLALGFVVDPWALLLLMPAAALAMRYVHLSAASRTTESRRVAELTDSARNELKQSEAEERSILNYVKCENPSRAWAKIKTYRGLAAHARELEVTLKALLGGRRLEDWEANEAELDRELSSIRRELENDFRGYAPATEEAESWRSEYAALQHSLPAAQARLHEVHGSLESERRNALDLAALEGEIEFLHRRKGELEFLYKAYNEAINALGAVIQTASEEYLPALSERAARYLERITSGRYISVCAKPGWQISIDCRDRSALQPSALSVGTLDQLYFALRIACGELLSAGRRLPIILDDPFVNFDRSRLDNVLGLLGALAGENQMLLLTHDPYILEWARNLASSSSVSCLVHELPGPMVKAGRK